MMNSKGVSSTGYAVGIKTFMLLASATCQNGKSYFSIKEERWFWHVQSFVKKNEVQVNLGSMS
jgi:hypothetical protein